MKDHAREKDTAAWLRQEYGDALPAFPVTADGAAGDVPWPKVQRRIAQLIKEDRFYTPEEQDRFDNVDPVAIREALAERGIVDGQVADPEKLDNDPFIRQVMRDVDAIAAEEQDEARPEPPAPDLSGQPVTREGDTITIGNGEPTHEIDITVSDEEYEAIQQAIHEASDHISVTALSNDPELTRRQYGLEAIPRFRVWKVFSALRRCDALLSGGGSLLQDTTSTRSLLYYLTVIRCAHWLGKPVMLYANGIGPVRRPANRRRVKRVVDQATLITLRDHSSARELQDMGVTRTDLHVTADPVFHLSPASEARGEELLAGAGVTPGEPFVAVSVRDWPDTGDFCRQLAQLCDHLHREYGLAVLFLLMQPSRDRATAQQVQSFMAEPSCLLDTPCTPRELMAVLGKARLCLAMRLHTLIFAARMAVPSMGLVYDPKVDSYLKELDLPAAGRVDSFDAQEAIRRADALMADYPAVLSRLKEKSAAMTRAAGENERLLLEMLEEHRKH